MQQSTRLSWSELFFGIAELAAKRSEDPHTKVGACLVKKGHVIGIGYNGSPRDFNGDFDWHTSEKYDYVIHAELNAVSNACSIGVSCVGAELYCTLSPCHECMKLLVQHQIKTVFFKDIYEKEFDLSLKIATCCGIKMVQVIEGKERQWN